MTIATETSRVSYIGNGVTTVFAYTFKIFAADDLVVSTIHPTTLAETTLTYPAQYSVSGVGLDAGGNVTIVTAPLSGHAVVIRRVVTLTQETNLRNSAGIVPVTLEAALDRSTMMAQQLQDQLDQGVGGLTEAAVEALIADATYTEAEVDALVAGVEAGMPPGVLDATLPPYSVVAGAGDNLTGLQAAIDAAIASSTVRTVQLPVGTIKHSKPIVQKVADNGLIVRGVRGEQTQIMPYGSWFGPLWVTLQSDYPDVPTGTELYSGAGPALSFTRDGQAYLAMHDAAPYVHLRGMTAFTVEFRVRVTLDPGSGTEPNYRYAFMSAHTRKNRADDVYTKRVLHIEYSRLVANHDELRAFVNIGGTVRQIQIRAGAPVVGNVYDFAIDYDGTNLRSYYKDVTGAGAATHNATVACTGTIQHGSTEAGKVTTNRNDIVMGNVSKAKIRTSAFNILVYGTSTSIADQEVAFTATTHDIAQPDGQPREALYLVSVSTAGVVTITKGADAISGSVVDGDVTAVLPALPAGQAAIGSVLVRHNGTAPFDATTDLLDAAHLKYVDADGNSRDAIEFTSFVAEVCDFTIGCGTGFICEATISDPVGFEGQIGGIRISTSALYAGTYAPPTTPPTASGSTHFLLNNDTWGVFAVATLGGVPFYMLRRSFQLTGFANKVQWHDLVFHGEQRNMWAIHVAVAGSQWYNLRMLFGGGRGWLRFNNCFLNHSEKCTLSGTGGQDSPEVLLCQSFLSGIGTQFSMMFEGGVIQHAQVSGTDTTYFNYHAPSEQCITGLYLWGGSFGEQEDGFPHQAYNLSCGQEQEGGAWQGAIYIVGGHTVSLYNPEIEGQTKPSVVIDSCKLLTVHDGRMNTHGGNRGAIKFISRGQYPVEIYHSRRRWNKGVPAPFVVPKDADWVRIHHRGHISQGSSTLTAGDATPSIRGNSRWISAADATALTDFDDEGATPPDGWEITIEFTGVRTITYNAAIVRLLGAANFVASADDEITLVHRGGIWREASRSVN